MGYFLDASYIGIFNSLVTLIEERKCKFYDERKMINNNILQYILFFFFESIVICKFLSCLFLLRLVSFGFYIFLFALLLTVLFSRAVFLSGTICSPLDIKKRRRSKQQPALKDGAQCTFTLVNVYGWPVVFYTRLHGTCIESLRVTEEGFFGDILSHSF